MVASVLQSRRYYALVGLLGVFLICRLGNAAPRTWIGGNVDWVETSGVDANWSPNVNLNEPDTTDEAIFNTPNTVNLGTNNSIQALTMSGGIDLLTNDFDLTVDGLVQLGGASTNLIIGGAAGSINADDVAVNASGDLELRGGTLTLDEEVAAALVDINAGGILHGHGTITFADAPGVVTLLFVNDGTITASSPGLTIFSPPPVGTLQINQSNFNGRIDLDGTGEAGVVNVNRNQTLDINMPLFDNFNGTLNLSHNSTFDLQAGFTLAGGSIVVDNGFVDGALPFPDIPADTSYIVNLGFNQTGGTINVVDTDGTLQIDANYTMSGGTFTNSGTVIFNGSNTISTAAGYAPTTSSSETVVNGSLAITEVGGNFNWDGPGTASTTVNGTGVLTINVGQVDTGDDVYGGVLTLNDNADVTINVAGTSWTMANQLIKNNTGTAVIDGDRMVITGQVHANAGTLDMGTVSTTASTTLAVTSTLTLGGVSELGGALSISGPGLLRMEGTSTVTANTTIGVATFDWDGLGTGTTHTINAGAVFTINSSTLDSDGDMDDPITLAGSGSTLIVNGPTQWTATAAINSNNAAVGTATIGGTSKMFFSGVNADWNVNGNTAVTTSLTLGASSTVDIDANMTLDADGSTVYDGVFIDGAGTFDPGPTNTVVSDSTINCDTFDFDAGNWVIEAGAELTFNALDYDAIVATNAFDTTITLNNGAVFASVADPTFVMARHAEHERHRRLSSGRMERRCHRYR